MSIDLRYHLWPKGKSPAEPDLLPSVLDSDGDPVGFYDQNRITSQSTVVDLGDAPNTNNGDPLRIAFAKINNFIEASYWTNESVVAKHREHDSDFNELFSVFKIDDPNHLRVKAITNFDSDVYIQGSLVVNGTQTALTATNTQITDNVLTLNYGQASPFNDTGIVFTRYDSDNVSATNWNGYLVWDESVDRFMLGETSQSGHTVNPTISMRYKEWGSGSAYTYDATNTLRIAETFGATNTYAVTGNYEIDASGDIYFDADGNNFIFQNGGGNDTSTVTFDNSGNWTQTIPANYEIDAVGDITFDADSNNFVYQNGAGGDSSTVTFADDGNWTQTYPNNLTFDVVTDITFDADGNNFIYKNGAGGDTSTVTFADDGNWTQAFPADYYIQVTGDDVYLQGTTSNEQLRFNLGTGTQTVFASDNLTLDAVGDITFDADGNDFIYKNGGGGDTSTVTFANDANWTQTFPANYTIDAVGDITFDADGNDFVFKNGAAADTSTVTFADDANWTQTYPNNLTFDVVGDITFDADGNNFIYLNGAGGDTSTVTFADNANWTQAFPADYYIQVTGDDVYLQGTTSGEQLRFNLGTGTQTVYASDNLTLDAVGDITFDADGNDFIYKNGAGADTSTVTFADDANWTQTYPNNLTFDAVGDITLDADGRNFIYKNGSDGDTSTVTFEANGTWTQAFPNDYYIQVAGDDVHLQGNTANESIRFNLGTGTQTVYASDNLTLDAAGDITFDAEDNNFIYKNGFGGDTSTVTFADDANWTQTFPANYTIDAVGDITFDADGNDFVYKNGAGGDTSTVTFADNGNWTQAFPADYYVQVTGDDVYFQGPTGAEEIRLQLGDTVQKIISSDDLSIQSPQDVIIGNLLDDMMRFGYSAGANDSPFVIRYNTTDSKWELTGDGTAQIDGGSF